MKNHTHLSNVTIGVIGGAALGAGLALLYAPRAGAETRRQLHDYGQRGRDRMHDASARLRAQGHDLVARGRRAASRLTEHGRDFADRSREFAERGRDVADRTASHFHAVADDVRGWAPADVNERE